jgi:hypothetical protein
MAHHLQMDTFDVFLVHLYLEGISIQQAPGIQGQIPTAHGLPVASAIYTPSGCAGSTHW